MLKENRDKYAREVELNPNNPQVYYNRANYYKAALFARIYSDADNECCDGLCFCLRCYKYHLPERPSCLSYSRAYQIELMIEDYTVALRLNPHDTMAFQARGEAYEELQDYPNAIADYTAAIKLNPRDFQPYLYRWGAYMAQGRLDLASVDYEIIYNLNYMLWQKFEMRYSSIAAERRSSDRRYRPLSREERFIRTQPSPMDENFPLLTRSALRENDNQYFFSNNGMFYILKDFAVRDFLKLKSLVQMDQAGENFLPESLTNKIITPSVNSFFYKRIAFSKPEIEKLTIFLWEKREFFLASKLLKSKQESFYQLLKEGRSEPWFEYTPTLKFSVSGYDTVWESHDLIKYYSDRRDFLERSASTNYDLASARQINYPKNWWQFSRVFEIDKSIEDYTTVIGLNPACSSAYYNRGILYQKKKEFSKALIDYAKVVELVPIHAAAYYGRAEIYCIQRKYDFALWNYLAAIFYNPHIYPETLLDKLPMRYRNQRVIGRQQVSSLGQINSNPTKISISRSVNDLNKVTRYFMHNLAASLVDRNFRSLTHIALSGGAISDDIDRVLTMFTQCSGLTFLDLSKNNLQTSSTGALFRQLLALTQLAQLLLAENRLDDTDLKNLLSIICEHPRLKNLNLQNNFIQLSEGYINEDILKPCNKRLEFLRYFTVNINIALNFISAINVLTSKLVLPDHRILFHSDAFDHRVASIVHPSVKINQEHWLIAIYRHKKSEHVRLMFEGINMDSQRFITTYDYRPVSKVSPCRGVISDAKPFDPKQVADERIDYRYIAFLVPKTYVEKVWQIIEFDKQNKKMFYMPLGHSHPSACSYNCLTWATTKLHEAGISAPKPSGVAPVPSFFLNGQVLIEPHLCEPSEYGPIEIMPVNGENET